LVCSRKGAAFGRGWEASGLGLGGLRAVAGRPQGWGWEASGLGLGVQAETNICQKIIQVQNLALTMHTRCHDLTLHFSWEPYPFPLLRQERVVLTIHNLLSFLRKRE